jgi:hypothetical protein
MTQLDQFYRSHLANAATLHERMAVMQAAAGNHRLADDSRKVASARRIAAANVSGSFPLPAALDFGEFGVGVLWASPPCHNFAPR